MGETGRAQHVRPQMKVPMRAAEAARVAKAAKLITLWKLWAGRKRGPVLLAPIRAVQGLWITCRLVIHRTAVSTASRHPVPTPRAPRRGDRAAEVGPPSSSRRTYRQKTPVVMLPFALLMGSKLALCMLVSDQVGAAILVTNSKERRLGRPFKTQNAVARTWTVRSFLGRFS